MGNLSKKLISIVTTVVVISGITFTSLPAIEAKAQTSVTTTTTATSNTDLDAALKDQVESNSAENYGLTKNTKDGVILHAFCWSFNTVKQNMKEIAEAGYSTVQTSPINQCLEGDGGDRSVRKWYFHYQPTDWKIGNYQLGTREEFKEMCDEAHKYGVKIICDVLPNHTTPTLEAVSQDLKNAAGGQGNLYHAKGFDEIKEQKWAGDPWANRLVCTTYMMNGLPDVNTENKGFQEYYLKFENDAIACGCDGFRFDTAKHIGCPSEPKAPGVSENDFWPVATGKKSVNGVTLSNASNLFLYAEILQGESSIPYNEYGQYMGMCASQYGMDLRDAIGSKNFSAGNLTDWRHSQSGKLVTWVESHDNFANKPEESYKNSIWMSNKQVRLGWAVIAARKDNTPLFYNRVKGADANNQWPGLSQLGDAGNDNWKEPEVAMVNKFRNAMVGENENLRNPNGNNSCLMIERGKRGLVITNLGGGFSLNSQTNLADGKYTDAVSGDTYNVSNGTITGNVPAEKVVVLGLDQTTKPTVGISPDVRKFKGNSIQVTLKTTNSTSATYSIDGGAETAYTDGQTKPIGENTPVGGTVKITLRAKDDKGNTAEETYTFTKIDGNPKAGVYFNKPSDWGTPTVYIYDDSVKPEKNNGWPGVAMTDNGDGEYYYEIPSDYKNPKIIFAASGKQFPEPQQPGHAYKAGTALTCDGANWTEQEITDPLVAGAISTDEKSPQNVNTAITISTEAATGGVGEKTYKFEVGSEVIKDFSASKSVNWTPTKAGTYTIKVTAKDSNGATQSKTMNYVIEDHKTELKINDFSANLNSPQLAGTGITLTTDAVGEGKLTYKYIVQLGSKQSRLQNYKENNSIVWKPTEAGLYKVFVACRDESGNKVARSFYYLVNSNLEIRNFRTNIQSPQNAGTAITLSAAGVGQGNLTYKFVAEINGKATILQDYNKKSAVVWKPTQAGTYTLSVALRDQSGKVVTKRIAYVVKNQQPVSISKIITSKESPQAAGTAIKVAALASSKNGSALTYKFTVHEATQGFKVLSGFTSSNLVTWTPQSAGIYTIFVEARDAAGNRAFETLTYSVTVQTTVISNSNQKIKYSGVWNTQSGIKYTDSEMASLAFNFTGDSIAIVAKKGPSMGTALVVVDGVEYEVDLYSNVATNGTIVFSKKVSAKTTHSISILSLGLQNANSQGTTLNVVSFNITNGNIK